MRHSSTQTEFCRGTRDFLTGLVIFVVVFMIAALDSRAARPAETAPGAMAAQQGQSGALFMPGEDTTALSNDIRISVTGGIARTTVSQSFRHAGAQKVRGQYMFPLPEGASVSRFDLRVGARGYQSRIVSSLEKPKAPAPVPIGSPSPVEVPPTVPAAVAQGMAGEIPAHMFVLTVGDVAPGDVVTVRFEYQQTLQPVSGVYSLRFPLSPGNAVDPKATATGEAARPISLSVRLAPGFEIGDIGSFNHPMAIRRLSERDAVLVLTGDDIPAGKDFELAWSPKPAATPAASLFIQDAGAETAYGMAMIAPPALTAAQPRELVLLLDASGSMSGPAFDQARDVTIAAIGRLGRHDRFNIIAFNDGQHSLFDTARDANPTSIAAAEDFLRRIEPHGGGDMLGAVSAALRGEDSGASAPLRQVIAVTDGAISTGNEFFAEIAAKRGKSRLFFVGVGPAPDLRLLQRAAQIGRGDALHIVDRKQTGELLARLYARIERPAVTDLKIAWPAGTRPEMSPEPLPDLYAGDPLMAVFRLGAARGAITITGQSDGKPWSAELPLSSATPATGLAAQWAQAKIGRIEAQRLTGKPAQETAEAIEQLALAHGLTSQATHLTAVSADPAPARDAIVAVRHGLRLPGIGSDLRKQVTAASANVSQAAESPVMAQASQPRSNYLTVFALALVFGGMTALTLALWRHLHRSHAPATPRRLQSREWRDQVR